MTFQLRQPDTIAEACELLAGAPAGEAALIAGGTDLLSEIRDGTAAAAMLVALDGVADAGLRGVSETADGGVHIGALTTIAAIAADGSIRRRYAALAQAAGGLATPQVRNLGTLGGNLNQRPRCWYYRHPLTVCLKRGGDRCYALAGVSKYLCITGGDRCFIVHPSDTAVALTALGATASIASGDGAVRRLPIADYFTGPDVDLTRENVLRPGEILVDVSLPPLPAGTESVYLKARERESGDFALVSVAAVVSATDGVIRRASVVLGGVAPKPYRAAGAEGYLVGRRVSAVAPAEAGAVAIAEPRPLRDNGYKAPMAANLVARAVGSLLSNAG